MSYGGTISAIIVGIIVVALTAVFMINIVPLVTCAVVKSKRNMLRKYIFIETLAVVIFLLTVWLAPKLLMAFN